MEAKEAVESVEISVKKVRVERWIEIKGSRENELRDAEHLGVVAVCQRSPTKS